MPLAILFFLALLLPRVTILVLWILTNWFVGVFTTPWVPLLGSLFFPYALLWYSVVMNMFGGVWNIWTAAVMLVAVCADLGSGVGRYWTDEPELASG